MRVREDEILRSNGEKGIYGVVEKHDGAIILPIEDGRIWLVEQFRYTIQQRALELPQGGWEDGDRRPEELARGELKEELGLGAAEMIYLGAPVDCLRLSAAEQQSSWPPASPPLKRIPTPRSTTRRPHRPDRRI